MTADHIRDFPTAGHAFGPAELSRPRTLWRAPSQLLQVLFYMFVFSIPLEIISQNLGIGSNQFTVTRMIGAALILAAFGEHTVCFQDIPKAFWYVAIYQWVYLSLGVMQDVNDAASFIPRILTRFQLMLLLLIAYNLLLDQQTGQRALLVLILGCATLAMLMILGVSAVKDIGEGRVSIEGANANELGMVLGLGLVALVGYAFQRQDHSLVIRLALWSSLGVLTFAVVSTGSRGALAALVAGLLTWGLCFDRGDWASKFSVLVIAVLCIAALVWMVYSTDSARSRWENTIQKGDTAGRERIFTASWEMFLDRPLTGWGPVSYGYELGSRTGVSYRGAHNLYLFLLIETGLLGAVPFFIALGLCLQSAWRNRGGAYGVLPLALLVLMLIANLSGDWLDRKLLWMTLAYALASDTESMAWKSLSFQNHLPGTA